MTLHTTNDRPVAAPAVLDLADRAAVDPDSSGAKAAALARAAEAGLPVLPGFVVTTAAVDALADGGALPPEVQQAWQDLSEHGARSLVVRSSSTAEDLGDSSMAGRFESVVDVRGEHDFATAVQTVIASRETASGEGSALRGDEPLAVLVQPLLDARCGGVLFGIDPVSGREDQLVVAVVEGGPDRLVSGDVDGSRYVMTPEGRRCDHDAGDGGARLRRRDLSRLADLARRAAEVFGGPQDVEWAFDHDGRLWLLQSRPVTAEGRGRPTGPVLGPGPVAETFPEALSRLEQDLWVPPLRSALRSALQLAGTSPAGRLDDSPLVVVVEGRVAVDLEALEPGEQKSGRFAALDPRPKLRRLRASWRVGRLRAALPALGRDVVADADAALAAVPDVAALTDAQLAGLLRRTQPALAAVHAHEALLGMLVDAGAAGTTGVGTAMAVLSRGRALGMSDDEVLRATPAVLALVPPRVGPPPTLPDVGPPTAAPGGVDDESDDSSDEAVLREALRLRTRWLQELSARAAWELAGRWSAAGRLGSPDELRDVSLDDLTAAAADPDHALRPAAAPAGEPLPARFRTGDTGRPIPMTDGGSATGAGGGRQTGPVHQGDDPPEGAVLVVRNLDPALAPVLPRLAGLVAETGSVLAHLAILAREQGVATVVGVAGATDDLQPGTVVTVDGDAGTVEREEEQR